MHVIRRFHLEWFGGWILLGDLIASPSSVIEILLKCKRECISDEDEDGNTPLHLAALNGHHKSAKVLLDYQADFHAR